MADRVCTRFIDDDGLDIGCHLVSKEYVLEAYPELVPWMKTPALWGWGAASYSLGMLAENTVIARSSPVQTISGGTNWKSVSAGRNTSAAIKTDGTLWIWGNNTAASVFSGGLGDNTTIDRSSPVQTVSGGTNWKSVSVGGIHAGAIKTDGTLWMWGPGLGGLLGNNSTIDRSSPVQTISGGTNWKSVSLGYIHSSAIKTDGTLWLWGYNTYGKLGTNNAVNHLSPVQTISGGTNWKSISASGYHNAAIKTDGTLWVWGCNTYGALGINSIATRISPVQTVSGGSDWSSASAGGSVTAAIKTNGTLWLWGRASYGGLGTNNLINRSSPVQTVSGGTNWKSVSTVRFDASRNAVSGIKTDGTLWMWGNGYNGQLGNSTASVASSPVQTISEGTGWRQTNNGVGFVFAIRDEGEF